MCEGWWWVVGQWVVIVWALWGWRKALRGWRRHMREMDAVLRRLGSPQALEELRKYRWYKEDR